MLKQLASPTFFNINIFTADYWGTWPVSVILGLALVILFLLAWFFDYFTLKKESRLLVLLALCYLPCIFSFFNHAGEALIKDFGRFAKTTPESRSLTLCQMDAVQNIGGAYCGFSKYLPQVTALVPVHSKVKLLFNPALSTYANYFLYTDFRLVSDIEQADYLIFFFPQEQFSWSGDGTLSRLTADKLLINYGSWQKIAYGSAQVMILKRL